LRATLPILDNSPSTMAPEDPPPREYTIDELATEARVPSRTIRFYQSKGALPGPKIRGRVAIYGDEHVARLELIGELQDRGLRIKAIRDLLGLVDKGELNLSEWLGLEHKLGEPWANDRPRVVTEEELALLLGPERRPGIVADLLRLRQIERNGDCYLIRSPALLAVGLRLAGAGIDLETAGGAAEILRKHLARAAGELTEYFYRRVGAGFGKGATAADLGAAYEALRPLGQEALRVIFGQEIERQLRKLLESGVTREIPARARRTKRR
jgi:DNA-binding transcriptional MerR regulator